MNGVCRKTNAWPPCRQPGLPAGRGYDGGMANESEQRRHAPRASAGGGVFGLGFIGTAVYYISHAASFGAGVLGVLKALVWPAFLVYLLLESLHA